MKFQKLTLCALLAAFICVIAPFSLPFGAVPLSLATFAVYIVASTVDIKIAIPSLLIYIFLGSFGLPVFSGFTGGFQQLAGITGGYIIGYIPCVITVSLLTTKFKTKKFIYPTSMVFGTLFCYAFGILWYVFQTKCNIQTAFAVCVLPFIAGDVLKIVSASIVGYNLRIKLSRMKG